MPIVTKEQLLSIIRDQHPSSIASLKRYLKRVNLECSDEELIAMIGELSLRGHVGFQESEVPSSFHGFLMDPSQGWWVYAILFVALADTLLVANGSSVPFSLLPRQVLGLSMLGFLPGYSTLRAVFPQGDLSILERVVMSIFLSLLVSILSGTILGSALLLEATANVIVLTVFTFVMTLAASYRCFLVFRNKPK